MGQAAPSKRMFEDFLQYVNNNLGLDDVVTFANIQHAVKGGVYGVGSGDAG
jgi:hypothetical protein